MKTLLNLLPEEKKDAIQKRLRYRFLLWQLFLLFLLDVFYLTILISVYVILDFQVKSFQEIKSSSASAAYTEESRLTEYQKKFKETNTAVAVAEKINTTHLYFSRIFTLVDTLLPDGITIDRLETKEFVVSLSGKAAKREDLLLLDKKLKEADHCITDIDIPVSNLFSQENIDFQVHFSIVPDCLKKDAV